MLKKVLGILMFLSFYVSALQVVPTVLDNVQVKVFTITGTTVTGRVTYLYAAGDNDSLNISLKIDPSSTNPGAPACTITKSDGDVGTIEWANGMNGKREIFFECTFAAVPAITDQYIASVTIVADQSNLEKQARAIFAQVTNANKGQFLGGNNCFSTLPVPGGSFGTIKEFQTSDGPHGVNRRSTSLCATLFPCWCAGACTFDTALAFKIAQAITQEAKPAAENECNAGTVSGQNVILGPMLNMVRDPRDGRAFETFSEDPYLTGKMAAAHVRGIQSEHVIATPKHFVCNDQEKAREYSSSNCGDTTLRQWYAYPFEIVAREAHPWAFMAAYNQLNDTNCTEHKRLLTTILKNEWGFRGFVMTDWFTWLGISATGVFMGPSLGANAGTDLEMPKLNVFATVDASVCPQDLIDDKVLRQLRGKVWCNGVTSFADFTSYPNTIGSTEHNALADEAAHKSIVLAKNDLVSGKALLPIDANAVTSVAVVGPYANVMRVGGAGPGTSSLVTPCNASIVTPLAAITAKIGAAKVTTNWQTASIVIVFVGIPSTGDNAAYEGHDRPSVNLPVSEVDGSDQNVLVQQILNANKPTVVVMTGGAGVAQGAWSNAPAVVIAMYPGQAQGAAIADVLFGSYNPCGKLSVTFPIKEADLPPYTNDNLQYLYEGPADGRGYSYFIKKNIPVLFPFGWGLHYTTFSYSNLTVPASATIGERVAVTVNVTNTGAMAGDEVVQLYLSQKTGAGAAARPIQQLRGFARVSLQPGASQTVTFNMKEWDFAHWDTKAGWIVDQGSAYDISVLQYSKEAVTAANTKTITLNN